MNNKKSTILVAALSLSFVLSTQSVLAVEDQAGQAGYVSETDSSGKSADTDLIFTIDQQIKLSSAGYSPEEIIALDKKAREEKAALGQDFDLDKFVKDKIAEKENAGLGISDPVVNDRVGSPSSEDRDAVDASSSATYYKKANWENKIKDKSRWKVEDAQNLVRVGGGDPLQMNDIDYDGMFIDGNGRYVIRLVYKEKSQALSGVWYRALINFGDLDKYIDYDLSYVLGKDGKTQYKFEDVQNVVGKGFDLGRAAGDRTTNRANLPINLVLKEGIDLKTLGNENYIVQMRITDGNYNRVYAYAPGKTSMDYSTYTKTTAVDLADKLGTLFIKGGKQSDLNNATNQEFFMSEFIANPDQYDDKLNLGIIRTQYMGQTNTIVRETVGGQPIAFTQVFDANLVNYLKADKAGNVAYVNVLTNGRVLSPVTKNVGIPLDKINYSKDRKLAYIVIGTEAFKKDGVQVVTVPKLDQHVMLSGFYITAIDYVVDKGKFEDTFAGRTQGIDKTRKLNYSMMSGWTNPNNDGWTIYEKDYDDDYVVPEGDSYLIDTGEDPTGGQIMLQIGGEQAILRKPQGYYNGYVSGSGANDAIEKYANGVYEIKLREGATILQGKKLKLYMPYTSSHDKQVNFLEIHNGTKLNEGGATLTLQTNRNIKMHLYKQNAGYYKLKYTLKDETEGSIEFKKGITWMFKDKDGVMTGTPNRALLPSGGTFYIDTTKLKTGADIFVESYDAKGNKIDSETSWFKYKPLEKSKDNVKLLTWTDHSDKKSVLSINKSLYTPYQQIFTNDYAGGNVYENPKALPADEAAFNTDTKQIVGYTKYDGGKVRTLFEGGKTGNFIAKVEAEANEYDDKGNLKEPDVRKDITIKKDNIFDPHFDGNNKIYKAYQYRVDLAKMLAYHSDDDKKEHELKLLKDMKFVSTASDGSSLPSDLYETRVRTRVLFDATDGQFADSNKKSVKIVPDNVKFYGEEGYVANGFEGANVEANTGDKFPENPKLDGKNFLGWVTEAGKKALGGKAVVTADKFNALSKDQIFTNETPITKHLVVYAVYSDELTVTFDANQGRFTDGKDTSNVKVNNGSVTAPTPTRDGFTFKGWAADKNATEADANILNNITAPKTVYAVWEKKDKEPLQLNDPTPVEVKDTKSLSSDEIDKVKKAVAEANKDKGITEADITVAEDGTVTVTKDGKTGTLAPEKTVKQKEVQNEFNPPKEPVKVDKIGELKPEEIAEIKKAVKDANPDRNFKDEDITVEADGTVKINQGGKVGTISADKTVVQKDTILDLTAPEKTEVRDTTNLTQEERDKVAAAVKKANEGKLSADAKVTVDDKGNVTVKDGTKNGTLEGKDTVKKFDRTGKEIKAPAKTKVANTDNLTDAEKQAVREAVKAANPHLYLKDEEIQVDNNGAVSFPMGQGQGTFTPEQTIEQATQDDKIIKLVAPAKTPVQNLDQLTAEEKEKVKKAVKDANQTLSDTANIQVAEDGSVVVTDGDKTGTLSQKDTVVDDTTKLTLNKPRPVKVKDPQNVTTEEQAKIKKAVKDVNPGLTDDQITVDDKGNVTVTVKETVDNQEVTKTAKLGPEDTIEKDETLNAPTPVEVKDPSKLTDEEKKAVEKAVKDANSTLPADATIEVGNDGTVTVKKDGQVIGTLTPAQTVKKAGAVVAPANPVEVKNPSELTDEEKEAVKKAVKDANSTLPADATIEVGNDGTVTVKKDGQVIGTLTPAQTVKKAKIGGSTGGSTGSVFPPISDGSGSDDSGDADEDSSLKPIDKVEVKDKDKLTDAEKKEIADRIKEKNPGIKDVEVDDKGNVTVTKKDGTKTNVPAGDVLKEAASKNPIQPIDKVDVKDPNKLTDAEKDAIADKIKKNNPTVKDVKVDDKGNVEITNPDGSKTKISAKDVVSEAEDVKVVIPKDKVKVKDLDKLTEAEKKSLLDKVKKANPNAIKVEFDDKGNIVLTFDNGLMTSLPYRNLVTKVQKGAVMVPHKSKSEGEAPLRNRKGNKGARNVKTGVSEVGGLFGVVGTAIAGLFVTRKKEDEEEK
ncbi:repeat protein [Anaerococcus lactolyticus ATCC 51172]|uniref:Repeat protein n=1 Tax=Anaerococcus lactolyticus ATCC 51172 TaxID=525254 RepID=C2BEV8_9FIRM|nr:InlB B-repeat-containing protein [Anaerococcus lactolyticus]EEI86620.1 repeat protein [Anaerococcus lactolyticus ATCC 51172]